MKKFLYSLFAVIVVLILAILFVTPANAQTSNPPFIWPVSGFRITTYYSSWHQGIDLAVPCGTPIHASKSGTVTYAGWDTTGYGNRIDIDDGEDRELYGHLSQIQVFKGEWIPQGMQIGKVGTTGRSTGCHLHFEIKWSGWNYRTVNPLVSLPKL